MITATETEVEIYCDAQTFGGSRIDPPEYCEELATRSDASGNWCDRHGNYETDPDDYRDSGDEPSWWDAGEPTHYNEY